MENGQRRSPLAGRIKNLELGATALGLAVFFVLGTGLGVAQRRSAARALEQPIAFNHRLHVEDVELSCLDCHEFYESEAFSGLPGPEVCAFCHEEAQGESVAEQELAGLLAEGAPLAWRSLFRQPSHVFYSHRRHVVVAGLECRSCHGDFAKTETPPRRASILSMEECLECHQREGVAEDCTACHR